jgi:hypothetical protein
LIQWKIQFWCFGWVAYRDALHLAFALQLAFADRREAGKPTIKLKIKI